ASRLPLQIGNLANDELDECQALIEGAAARDGELFLYALLTVMSRMTAPWQLIRLGVKAAGSDTAARVAETNYGVAVNIVLAELERMVAEKRGDLGPGQGIAVGSLLKNDPRFGTRTAHRARAARRQHLGPCARGAENPNFRSASRRNRVYARARTALAATADTARNSAGFGAGPDQSRRSRGVGRICRRLPIFCRRARHQ